VPQTFTYNPRPANPNQRPQAYNKPQHSVIHTPQRDTGQHQMIEFPYAEVVKDSNTKNILEWVTPYDPNAVLNQIFSQMTGQLNPYDEDLIYDVVNNDLHKFIGSGYSDFGDYIGSRPRGPDKELRDWPICGGCGMKGVGNCDTVCIGAKCQPGVQLPGGGSTAETYEIKLRIVF